MEFIKIDVAPSHMPMTAGGVKTGTAVHDALVIEHQHLAGLEFDDDGANAALCKYWKRP